jgi:hypothetical protein
MSDLLKISSISQDVNEYIAERLHYPGLDQQFVFELTRTVQAAKGTVFHQIAPPPPDLPDFELRHGAVSPAEVIIALGSAGVFTAVYETIKSYLERNQSRELTLAKGEVSVTIKGHTMPQERELLKLLAPELLPVKTEDQSDKKYAVFFNSSVYHIIETPETTICGEAIHGGTVTDIDKYGNKIAGRPGPELFTDVPPGRELCQLCARARNQHIS